MLTTPFAKPLFDSIHHIYHFQGKAVSTLKQCTLNLHKASRTSTAKGQLPQMGWDTLGVPTNWNSDSSEST